MDLRSEVQSLDITSMCNDVIRAQCTAYSISEHQGIDSESTLDKPCTCLLMGSAALPNAA